MSGFPSRVPASLAARPVLNLARGCQWAVPTGRVTCKAAGMSRQDGRARSSGKQGVWAWDPLLHDIRHRKKPL